MIELIDQNIRNKNTTYIIFFTLNFYSLLQIINIDIFLGTYMIKTLYPLLPHHVVKVTE